VTYDSIYPDFFRAGVGRLQKKGDKDGDFLSLFSALEHFRRDITEQKNVQSILKVAELYLMGLGLFKEIAFFLINPANFDFELAHSAPPGRAPAINEIVRREIRSGRFAWALRQSTAVFFQSQDGAESARGVFHALGVASHRLGMFCGILSGEHVSIQEISFNLLSILLGNTSDALAGARLTEELENKILAANGNLQNALRENEVLARIPAESPSPVLRLSREGKVLFSNLSGLDVLRAQGCQVGDWISGEWMDMLAAVFESREKREFEAQFEGRVYAFLIVPVPESQYANIYGTDITARKTAEAGQERLIAELQEALAKVKTLSGLVPICAWCKKIRDDSGFWKQLEVFIEGHSDAVFSHGVCPDCVKKITGDLDAAAAKK
jgi:hypothetical protein